MNQKQEDIKEKNKIIEISEETKEEIKGDIIGILFTFGCLVGIILGIILLIFLCKFCPILGFMFLLLITATCLYYLIKLTFYE